MCAGFKFDLRKMEKLNDPGRLETLDPDVMWRAAGLEDPDVLVDVGAGTGVFAFEFARRMGHGTVYACDTEDVMLDYLREHIPPELTDRVVPVKSEETSVPLGDGIADLVFMVNLHHELDDPPPLLADAHRLLRDGGRLLVVDWKPEKTPRGPAVAIRVAPDTICAQARSAGFASCEQHDVLPWHSVVTATRCDAET